MAGAIQKRVFVVPKIGVVKLDVGIVSHVSRLGGGQREKILSQGLFMRHAISPEGAAGGPLFTQTFVVTDGVLNALRYSAEYLSELWDPATNLSFQEAVT